MNTFELIDIAFTALKQRKQSPLGWQHGCKSAMRGFHERSEEDTPTAGLGTAEASDPDYCRICTPKGYGCCRCDIACNE